MSQFEVQPSIITIYAMFSTSDITGAQENLFGVVGQTRRLRNKFQCRHKMNNIVHVQMSPLKITSIGCVFPLLNHNIFLMSLLL